MSKNSKIPAALAQGVKNFGKVASSSSSRGFSSSANGIAPATHLPSPEEIRKLNKWTEFPASASNPSQEEKEAKAEQERREALLSKRRMDALKEAEETLVLKPTPEEMEKIREQARKDQKAELEAGTTPQSKNNKSNSKAPKSEPKTKGKNSRSFSTFSPSQTDSNYDVPKPHVDLGIAEPETTVIHVEKQGKEEKEKQDELAKKVGKIREKQLKDAPPEVLASMAFELGGIKATKFSSYQQYENSSETNLAKMRAGDEAAIEAQLRKEDAVRHQLSQKIQNEIREEAAKRTQRRAVTSQTATATLSTQKRTFSTSLRNGQTSEDAQRAATDPKNFFPSGDPIDPFSSASPLFTLQPFDKIPPKEPTIAELRAGYENYDNLPKSDTSQTVRIVTSQADNNVEATAFTQDQQHHESESVFNYLVQSAESTVKAPNVDPESLPKTSVTKPTSESLKTPQTNEKGATR